MANKQKYISYHTNKIVLDLVLGENHTTYYKRAELKELIGIHGEGEGGKGGVGLLSKDEVMVIRGALEMRDKTIVNLCTPLRDVFMLDYDEKMDMNTVKRVLASAHSRIPVYRDQRSNIIGVLHVRSLIEIDPDDAIQVGNLPLLDCIWVEASTPVWDMLNMFQTGKGHMAIVMNPKRKNEVDVVIKVDEEFGEMIEEAVQPRGTPVGIVTLEDVFEELIQEEIHDEADMMSKDTIQRQVRIAEMFRRVSHPIPYTPTEASIGRQNSFGSVSGSYVASTPQKAYPSTPKAIASSIPKSDKKPTNIAASIQKEDYFALARSTSPQPLQPSVDTPLLGSNK
jgi:ankyrin repeat/SOCS box protein 13/metal transporter CNNM